MISAKQSSYPKVKINVLGNLHQEKTIYVLQDGPESESTAETNQSQMENENELQNVEDPNNIEI